MNNNEKIPAKVIGSIVAVGLMVFCGIAVETATSVTFPQLMQNFEITTSAVQWATTIYLLTVAVVIPLSALLKRNFKDKSLFLSANIIFIAGLAIDALAPTFLILLVGRIVQGIATGIALPLMFNIILEQTPKSKIGTMMGVGSLIASCAPAIGPTFGGLIVTAIGWRFIFWLLIPFLVVSLIIGTLSIQQKSPINKSKFDILSIIFIIIAFAALSYGFSSMGKGSIVNISVLVPLVVGIIALALLVYRSSRIDNPVIHLDVLKNTKFAGHVIAFFIVAMLTLCFSFILPNYIQLVNHQTAFLAGIICLPGAILGAVFSPIGGRLLDNFGARKPILTGIIFSFLGIFLYMIFGMHLNDIFLLIFYALYQIGLGLSFGNIMTSGLSYLNIKVKADGNAILTTLQELAGAIGTSIVSAIVAQAQIAGRGTANFAELTALGSEHGFIFMGIASLISFVFLYRVVRKKSRN